MLSDKDCEELAGIVITFAQDAPESLINRRFKAQIGASHSIITAGILSNKEKWEISLGRFLYWIKSKDIKEQTPPNDTNKE